MRKRGHTIKGSTSGTSGDRMVNSTNDRPDPLEDLPAIPANVIGRILEEHKRYVIAEFERFDALLPVIVEQKVETYLAGVWNKWKRRILAVTAIAPGNIYALVNLLLS